MGTSKKFFQKRNKKYYIMIYVVGHKNPDTDSIVSAIVMKDYFQKIGKKAKAIRVGKINKETEFVLKQSNASSPNLIKSLANKQVFLVDHNAIEQSGDGIEQAEIIGVLDHHNLGGIKSASPIYFRTENIGCTASLIFNLFQEKNISLNKKQCFLLLCAIISDTLKFTSPTTTKQDIEIAKKLAIICQQDIDKLAQEMFKAKSDIKGINLKDIILSDYKEYKEKNKIFGIGVSETTNPEIILEKKQKILDLLVKLKQQKKIDLMFFSVIDIIKKQAYLFIIDNKEKIVAEKAFKKKENQNLIFLSGIVSRKKQLVPAIIKAL